jgi:hypothetical protein
MCEIAYYDGWMVLVSGGGWCFKAGGDDNRQRPEHACYYLLPPCDLCVHTIAIAVLPPSLSSPSVVLLTTLLT